MRGIYRPRRPERTVLKRLFSHHFERFFAEYESRFERIMAISEPGRPEVEVAKKRLAGLMPELVKLIRF